MKFKTFSSLFPLLSLLHSGAVVQAQFADSSGSVEPFGNLKQLHVITRHGARLPLYKDPNTLKEFPEGPPLTPTGEKELYDVGLWLQKRYVSTTFGQDVFARFNSSRVLLESSALDRTITSANSLALGLFSAEARDQFNETKLPTGTIRPNVPVFMLELDNDVYLRGYDKCQVFHDRLEDLYSSAEWKALEGRFDTLLTKVATLDQFSKYVEGSMVPLKELYNVFDIINVKRSECRVPSATCDSIPEANLAEGLYPNEFAELRTAAYLAELLKYGRKTAGTDVSGNLLQKIVNRITMAESQTTPRFFLYSAHYPTLLGLMAAMNVEPFDDNKIPSYGSALMIEVYENPTEGGDLLVQMHFKSGDSDEMSTLVQSCTDQTSSECTLYKELSMFASNHSVQEWCRNCGNTVADVCQPEIVEPACNTTTTTSSESSMKSSNAALQGTLLGLVGGAVLTLIGCWCWQRRALQKVEFADAHKAQTTEQGLADISRESTEQQDDTSLA